LPCLSSFDQIGGVMISMLTLSEIDSEFEPQTGQTNDYKISISASPLNTQF
jgi:hypothetical protein